MSCKAESVGGYVESGPKETAWMASIVLIVVTLPDSIKQWSSRPLFLLFRIGPLLSSLVVAGGKIDGHEKRGEETYNTQLRAFFTAPQTWVHPEIAGPLRT